MMHFFQRLYFYYFYVMLAVIFLLIFPAFWWFLRKPATHHKANSVRSFGSRLLLMLTFIPIKIIKPNGAEIDPKQTYIYISNHSSYLDIFVLLTVLPGYYCFLGKTEMTDIPLFKNSFNKGLDIEVARNNSEQSAISLKRSITALRNGKSLIIFPEGGILPDPLKINDFKEGAFMMAIRNKIPVVPISLPDNHKRLPDEEKRGTPGKIRVILHNAVQTSALKTEDVQSLKNELHDLIQKDIVYYNEHR